MKHLGLTLIAVVAMAATTYGQSTPVQRVDAVLANLESKNVNAPTQPARLELMEAAVLAYPNEWRRTLTRRGLVINPAAPADLFDVGTLVDEVFTPSDSTEKRRAKAKHFIGTLQRYLLVIGEHVGKDRDVLLAGDVGKTAKVAKADRAAAARARVLAAVGDPTTDPD